MRPVKEDEKKVLGIIALIFGGIALVTSWMPFVNNASAVLAIIAFVLGIIALFINLKRKKLLSLISIMIAVVSFVIVLVTQASYGAVLDNAFGTKSSESNTTKVTSSSSSSKDAKYSLEALNKLAKTTKSVDEIYVTGKISVSNKGDIKPGIYDLTVTGGSGNIMGERNSSLGYSGMFINWVAASVDSGSTDYPSTIRIILFEGDTLEFSDISKIKLTAVDEKVSQSNKIGIGNYVVGRDIKAGTYKLSTNMTMDPEFDNLGWDIDIYNPTSKEDKSQTYDPGNSDVVVKLKEGDIITTNFDNTVSGESADEAQLIFTAVK